MKATLPTLMPFVKLVTSSEAAARMAWSGEGRRPREQVVADGHRKAQRIARAAEEEMIALAAAAPAFDSLPPAPKGGRWSTRKLRAAAEGLADAALDAVEERSKARAVGRLVEVVREADLPVVHELAGALDPEACLRYITGGRRSATIRARMSA